MKSPSLLKIAFVSFSFLSAGVFSLKIIELHLHLGTSSAESSPLFRVEKTGDDQWNIAIPNDGQWHNTGLFLPGDQMVFKLMPISQGENIAGLRFRLNGEEPQFGLKGKLTGFSYHTHTSTKNRLIEMKNDRGKINDIVQLRLNLGQF